MAYDERLAERVRDLLDGHVAVTERKMFGGIAWMVGGNMACGVLGDELIVRLGDEGERALEEPHTRPFDFTGRPMTGILMVGSPALEGDAGLRAWVERGVAFAESLPPK